MASGAAKRAFDLGLTIPGLILVSPLFLFMGAWIKLDSVGPAFFIQTRVGRYGRRFRMYKFRTMVVHAERVGGLITAQNDARITRAGRLLRRCKLDELPQLINVLCGEMSLVGPRPEVPHYVDMYTLDQRQVLELAPGVTDPASIRFRHEGELLAASNSPERTYVEEIMPEKIRINLEYAQRANVLTDFAIVVRTLFCMFRR